MRDVGAFGSGSFEFWDESGCDASSMLSTLTVNTKGVLVLACNFYLDNGRLPAEVVELLVENQMAVTSL